MAFCAATTQCCDCKALTPAATRLPQNWELPWLFFQGSLKDSLPHDYMTSVRSVGPDAVRGIRRPARIPGGVRYAGRLGRRAYGPQPLTAARPLSGPRA